MIGLELSGTNVLDTTTWDMDTVVGYSVYFRSTAGGPLVLADHIGVAFWKSQERALARAWEVVDGLKPAAFSVYVAEHKIVDGTDGHVAVLDEEKRDE